jgi:hypothetical protein
MALSGYIRFGHALNLPRQPTNLGPYSKFPNPFLRGSSTNQPTNQPTDCLNTNLSIRAQVYSCPGPMYMGNFLFNLIPTTA